MKPEKTPPNQPRRRGPNFARILYMGYLCVCLSVCFASPASAATIWEKASEIMQDVYTQILTISTIEMAEWSYENGYWCSKSGSYHALIPAAAKAWGLPVEGCSASEPQRIVDALSEGKLVVALMTKGHFTSSGHFIVLRGVENEQILVADPASTTRSQKAWDLSIILNEASKSAAAGGPFWIIG